MSTNGYLCMDFWTAKDTRIAYPTLKTGVEHNVLQQHYLLENNFEVEKQSMLVGFVSKYE